MATSKAAKWIVKQIVRSEFTSYEWVTEAEIVRITFLQGRERICSAEARADDIIELLVDEIGVK